MRRTSGCAPCGVACVLLIVFTTFTPSEPGLMYRLSTRTHHNRHIRCLYKPSQSEVLPQDALKALGYQYEPPELTLERANNHHPFYGLDTMRVTRPVAEPRDIESGLANLVWPAFAEQLVQSLKPGVHYRRTKPQIGGCQRLVLQPSNSCGAVRATTSNIAPVSRTESRKHQQV